MVYKIAIIVNPHNKRPPNVSYALTPGSLPSAPVETFLGFIQVIISGVLIFLILLHSGKDTGLSGAFGIGGAGGSGIGGGSMVEQNLDRATVFFSVQIGRAHV